MGSLPDPQRDIETADPSSPESGLSRTPKVVLPLRYTFALSGVFWTIYAILASAGSFAIRALVGQGAFPRQVFVWNFAEAYAWALSTPPLHVLATAYGFTRGTWRRSLAVHVAVSLATTTVVAAGLILLNTILGWADASTPFSARLIDLGFQELPRCLATMGLIHATGYYVRLRERERVAASLETRLARAKLEILRSQLDPHFLFNTLNAIATLCRKDPKTAEQMILQLGSLLRVSLECVSEEIPLEQELAFLDNYLQIQQTRFKDRLSVHWAVDPGLLETPVPSLVLQPLVENAIRHGIARSAAPGSIDIVAARDGPFVRIEVADNGVGAGRGYREEGFGLKNTRARLEQLYGERHTFRLESVPGHGCRATLRIPLPETRRLKMAPDAT